MKKKIAKIFFGIFGAIGAALAGLVGYQQIVLKLAQKKKDETHFMETWETEEGTAAYRSAGNGRPLLLIHSMMLGASSREWDDVIDGLAESDLQLQNGTCYPIEEDGKTVLEWDGSYDLDGEEYGVYGKTYFIGTDMVVASYSYPLSDADNGFSRAVSFLERVKVA